MYSLEIFALISELRDKLVGDYLKKFYEIDKGIFLFKFRSPLLVDLKGYIFSGKMETPLQPTSFAMLMRKHLENKKLKDIRQHEFERIVVMDFGDRKVIVELFGEGNIVLLDEDGRIIMPYFSREFRHRIVKRGEIYSFPPSLKNPLTLGEEDMEKEFSQKNKEIVRVLARELNFGGIYAEEICRRAKIDKKTLASNVNWNDLRKAIMDIVNEAEKHRGYIYGKKASPIIFSHSKHDEAYDSFNEAVKKIYFEYAEEEEEDSEIQRLKRVLKSQEENLEKLKEEERNYKEIGDLIYENYGEVAKALAEGKNKILIRGREIVLDGNTVEEIAGKYYEKAKKSRAKVEGLIRAMEEIKRKIEERKKMVEKERKEKKLRRKTFWFENYRWFITSSGMIVIGGKDAKTNEKVVKKYLGEEDLYFHADIHGAPSVVLKTGGNEVDEKTVEEVAQFAVCFSKAWSNNLWGISAYYAKSYQVSKRAESGEYVPKGAWIVRGKRNYVHKIPLRLAVGVIEYEGTKLVMCAPVSAVAARSKKYVIIEPGEMKKEMAAKEIAKILEWENLDEIVRILPPGKIRIVEVIG